MVGVKALDFIEKNKDLFTNASDKIWSLAEVGLQEYKSAKVLQKLLQDAGFRLEVGVGGMPTAFIATWGEGKPVIGFLGEYDALPGCSQKAIPVKQPIQEGAPGHGCGHNLLGVGGAAAAIAAKEEITYLGKKATLKYFGCPAEELLSGKVFMSAHHCFDGLDCAFIWHYGHTNNVRMHNSTAVNSAKFRFYGQSAHAATIPHTGKSALDACILMDVANNYLREHIIQDARIHSIITNGGEEPNVVPAFAEIWYYVRAPKRRFVEEIYGRIVKNAEAAAMMTETTFEIEFLSGCHEYLRNRKLGEIVHQNLLKVGPPQFSEEDKSFAAKLMESLTKQDREKIMISKLIPHQLYNIVLHEDILDFNNAIWQAHGSDDSGDVSYQTPLVQLQIACVPMGIPGHSWQTTAACGMGIGHKGMLCAAKVLALTALDLIENPRLLKEAYEEWFQNTKDNPYRCAFPEGAVPNLKQVRIH